MKRPDKWERELAEKLADRCCNHIWMKRQFVDAALPILTASVGTLLQAERAATIENIVQRIEGAEKKGEYSGLIIGLRELALADASALSAVVQQETKELREALSGLLSDEFTYASVQKRFEFWERARLALKSK